MHRTMNIRLIPILALMSAFLMMGFSQIAEAKRLGGGKSFGMQKQVAPKNFNNQKDSKQTPAQPAGQNAGATGTAGATGAAGAAAAGTAAKSGASKWLGPLAGIAAGGLLAAMIFGDGFENLQILDILIFALIAFLLFKLFVRRKQLVEPQAQGAYAGAHENEMSANAGVMHRESQASQSPATSSSEASVVKSMATQESQEAQQAYNPHAGGSIIGADLGDAPAAESVVSTAPEWFDSTGFVEGAKHHFVAMQAAWDQADLAALEGYCTAELFAALVADLDSMDAGANHTHVDELQAEIAQMAIEGDYFVVSVRYSGFIDEDGTGAHAFSEIWHIQRLAAGEGNWAVAGIQQTH